MTRLDLRFLATSIVLLLSSGACAPRDSPSVVLITIDTLRADRLGVYGYPRGTSPVLDAFAEEAIVFDNIVTEMATTLPAHVSLMTGTAPRTSGVKGNYYKFRRLRQSRGLTTLAQALARAGYSTAAFVSASPLKARTGISAGFESHDQPKLDSRRGTETAAAAVEWLRNVRPESNPFFLWVHIWDPHSPYQPEDHCAGYLKRTDPVLRGILETARFPDMSKALRKNNSYDREVACADHAVGILLQELRSTGLYEDAAIVVTADHGESLGQHDAAYHGRLYREQLQIPLIVKLPRSRGANRREPRLGSLVDVAPTLIDELALPVSQDFIDQLQGRSLLGRPTQAPVVVSERSKHPRGQQDPQTVGWSHALTTEGWKLLTGGPEEPALFDSRVDPHELTNRFEDEPDVASRMSDQLARILEEAEQLAPDEAPEEVDPELARELEALGYVSPNPD